MERELLITGIGGQGIQLASKIVAQAASDEGRNVLHFGVYGGMIRGGPSDCTVVVADGEMLAPPIVEEAWALLAMHPGSVPALLRKVRPGGVVLRNSTLASGALGRPDVCLIDVPATRIAEAAGRIVGASMVALGAFVEATGFAAAESVRAAMRRAIPPHRRALLDFNDTCLELGRRHCREAVAADAALRAWPDAPVECAAAR